MFNLVFCSVVVLVGVAWLVWPLFRPPVWYSIECRSARDALETAGEIQDLWPGAEVIVCRAEDKQEVSDG